MKQENPLDLKLYGVILAGGTGTRLWPLSRGLLPKQLLRLTERESLLQMTVRRLLAFIPTDRILTITQSDHAKGVRKQLQGIDRTLATGLLVEPEGRNTLPAIAWGVSVIHRKDPGAVVGVFPSDHLIRNQTRFLSGVRAAVSAARQGLFVTFGIRPTRPATGYGYILSGRSLNGTGLSALRSFHEKPDPKTARRLVRSRKNFWNAGIFFFRTDSFMRELKRLQPGIHRTIQKITAKNYLSLPRLSIDYGLMEKIRNGAVIPLEMGWDDLGSWESVYQALTKNREGNASRGTVFLQETEDSLLIADEGMIACVGLKGMVVVKNRDSVLICPRDKVEGVRGIVDQLRRESSHLA